VDVRRGEAPPAGPSTARVEGPTRRRTDRLAISGAINNHGQLIWAIADLLRGDYKQSEYGRVILPLVVLRRLDCVLEPTKLQVRVRLASLVGRVENVGPILQAITGIEVYNTSPLTLKKILADPSQVAGNLRAWIAAFDEETRDVIEKFDLDAQIGRLDRAKLLYLVLAKVTEVDLHPDAVSNVEMGYLYEELIRRFSELSNETAGEHFTPREVIRLMVDLLFIEDDEALRTPGIVRTMLDPACGTGGMLSVAAEYLRELNPGARLEGYGQELNAETYAICRSDMMLKGQKASNIRLGNSFSEDAFKGSRYDYLLANPPFGVEWTKVQHEVEDEFERLGFAGRFGAGLPRINDGSFLFVQHMIAKFKRPEDGGGRLAIVFNGSPLTTGGAGSGESEIRRWIIENDWLEGIVALPDQLFYNTEISTYFWIVTNRKRPERRGKVQLVDARDLFTKMRKSLGEKRKEVSPEQTAEITRLYGAFEDDERVKILPNESFGFQRITVERPLRHRYAVTAPTTESIQATPGWAKLTQSERDRLTSSLAGLRGLSSTDRTEISRQLGAIPKVIDKAVWGGLAVRDPNAPPITNSRGRLEPDRGLRFAESVALRDPVPEYEQDPSGRVASATYRQAVDSFVLTDISPYFPDAWVDHAKSRIGYDIPFVRHFYHPALPRPVATIDGEMQALESTIAREEATLQGILVDRDWDTTSSSSGVESGRLRQPLTFAEGWPVVPARALFALQRRPPRASDETVTAFRDGEVTLRSLRREEGFTNAIQEVGYQGVLVGDLVIHSMDAFAGAIGVCQADGKASPVVHCYRPHPGVEADARFYAYLLRVYAWTGFIGSLSKGIRARSSAFDSDTFLSLPVPHPPVQEQRAIADYLDDGLGRLDGVADARRRLLVLLSEKRQAAVAAAVVGAARYQKPSTT
jgi:type I restriction enzyme M protein